MGKRLGAVILAVVLAVGVMAVGNVEQLKLQNTKSSSVSAATTPVKKYGRLKVSGTSIKGKNGKKIQIKGVSTHGINWYPQYVDKKGFKTLRDSWGVNTVRLAMYTEEYNGYCSGGDQKELKKTVCKGVDALTELGMYAIIDWHILSDGNPNTHVSDAKKYFAYMAKKYKKNKNVIYEICNEPNAGTSWSEIKTYAKKVIKVIRKYDKNAIIIVGTPTWSQELDKAAESPIKGYKNIMYSLHFYSGTHKEELRNTFKAAHNKGLPVIVTEFGICDASGNGNVNKKEANTWIKLLKKYKVGYVVWNLSNKDESAALIKASCNKTYGWKKSELTTEGKWYKALK